MKKLFSLLLCAVLMLSAPSTTADAKDSRAEYMPSEIISAQPGQIITYGHYEQDNNLSNGKEPIEWLVLAKEKDRALVISRYSLESRPYNDEREEVTWETCTLRTWLNSTFLITAFTVFERKAIPAVTVVADKNPEDGTKAGKNTKDKIFLLSASEFDRYFPNGTEGSDPDPYNVCFPTDAAREKSRNLWHGYGWDYGFGFGWYLRTPGIRQDSTMVAYTYWEGDNGGAEITTCSVWYDTLGTEVDSCSISDGSGEYDFDVGVRPAMWISLNPKAYAASDSVGVQDGFFIDDGVAFLMADGTVRILQDDRFSMESNYFLFPLSECEDWTDITQLCSCNDVIAGLRTDGTVVASGKDEYVEAVSKWNHITELYGLSGDYSLIAGLRSDGRILIVGGSPYDDGDHETENLPLFKEIESWRNVSKLVLGVCPAGGYALALHTDGTVSPSWVYKDYYDRKGWSRSEYFVDLASSGFGVIALRDDGSCAVCGEDGGVYCDVTDTWTGLKQVGCGDGFAIGLRNDGTFVTSRDKPGELHNAISDEFASLRDIDHFEMPNWTNAILVYFNDGRVDYFNSPHGSGTEELRSWTNIEKVLITVGDNGYNFIGIKKDGRLVSTIDGLDFTGFFPAES